MLEKRESSASGTSSLGQVTRKDSPAGNDINLGRLIERSEAHILNKDLPLPGSLPMASREPFLFVPDAGLSSYLLDSGVLHAQKKTVRSPVGLNNDPRTKSEANSALSVQIVNV